MTLKMRLKIKNRSHRYDLNRPRSRHGHKYTKYKMSQYNDDYILAHFSPMSHFYTP